MWAVSLSVVLVKSFEDLNLMNISVKQFGDCFTWNQPQSTKITLAKVQQKYLNLAVACIHKTRLPLILFFQNTASYFSLINWVGFFNVHLHIKTKKVCED